LRSSWWAHHTPGSPQALAIAGFATRLNYTTPTISSDPRHAALSTVPLARPGARSPAVRDTPDRQPATPALANDFAEVGWWHRERDTARPTALFEMVTGPRRRSTALCRRCTRPSRATSRAATLAVAVAGNGARRKRSTSPSPQAGLSSALLRGRVIHRVRTPIWVRRCRSSPPRRTCSAARASRAGQAS
jgi:hypothetical protein